MFSRRCYLLVLIILFAFLLPLSVVVGFRIIQYPSQISHRCSTTRSNFLQNLLYVSALEEFDETPPRDQSEGPSTILPDNHHSATIITTLKEAIHHFSPTNSSEACRVFHGRGGLYPGCEHITLDWFPPVWLLTSYNEKLSAHDLNSLEHVILEFHNTINTFNYTTEGYNSVDKTFNLVYQFRSSNNATTAIIQGGVPNPHVVNEKGMKFLVRLDRAKNHGIFLDIAHGRDWIRRHAPDKHVLNLFAYTCGFSIAALSGGAESIVNIDMVDGVLKTGQRNHELNKLKGKARFLSHDIFKSWGKIRKLGPYDIIVADPPSFQKNSFVAKKDYGKLVRRLPDLLSEEGQVLLCLNAPELESQWLKNIVAKEAPMLTFIERLPNPESFRSVDEERSLKVLRYVRSDLLDDVAPCA